MLTEIEQYNERFSRGLRGYERSVSNALSLSKLLIKLKMKKSLVTKVKSVSIKELQFIEAFKENASRCPSLSPYCSTEEHTLRLKPKIRNFDKILSSDMYEFTEISNKGSDNLSVNDIFSRRFQTKKAQKVSYKPKAFNYHPIKKHKVEEKSYSPRYEIIDRKVPMVTISSLPRFKVIPDDNDKGKIKEITPRNNHRPHHNKTKSELLFRRYKHFGEYKNTDGRLNSQSKESQLYANITCSTGLGVI